MSDYWQGLAECAKHDPQRWDTDEPDPHTLAVCARCPVKEQCLRDALTRKERHGVRGGFTPQQRDAIRLGQTLLAAEPRTCRACKQSFKPTHHRARYCSPQCRKDGMSANQRRYDMRHREKRREWASARRNQVAS